MIANVVADRLDTHLGSGLAIANTTGLRAILRTAASDNRTRPRHAL